MKPREDVCRDLLRQWLAKADEDLGVAKDLLGSNSPYLAAIAFHAQQAVEKYLKAFLVTHQREFRRTHDLAQLLDLAASVDAAFAETLKEVVVLNPYAVQVRYPGETIVPSREAAEQAVALADKARSAIMAHLDT